MKRTADGLVAIDLDADLVDFARQVADLTTLVDSNRKMVKAGINIRANTAEAVAAMGQVQGLVKALQFILGGRVGPGAMEVEEGLLAAKVDRDAAGLLAGAVRKFHEARDLFWADQKAAEAKADQKAGNAAGLLEEMVRRDAAARDRAASDMKERAYLLSQGGHLGDLEAVKATAERVAHLNGRLEALAALRTLLVA